MQIKKFIKSIFENDRQLPINSNFHSFVRKSIPIIGSEGRSMDDPELIKLLSRHEIPEEDAIEIVLFVPTAFTRRIITEVSWPNYYLDYYSERKQIKKRYRDNPRYLIIEAETVVFLNSKPGGEIIINIAGRSAEFKAINQLLQNGSKIEDIQVSPCFIVRHNI